MMFVVSGKNFNASMLFDTEEQASQAIKQLQIACDAVGMTNVGLYYSPINALEDVLKELRKSNE